MISPTGNGTSPSTPTVSSRPGMNCSAMTSASYALATRMAGSNPSALRTSVIPTEEPIFDGLTITGHPSAVVTSSAATGAMNHPGTGTPAAEDVTTALGWPVIVKPSKMGSRSEEHTSELQS